jgi:hypothetical protein
MPRWSVWQTILACAAVCALIHVLGATLGLPWWWVVCLQVVLGIGVAWWGTEPVDNRHG